MDSMKWLAVLLLILLTGWAMWYLTPGEMPL